MKDIVNTVSNPGVFLLPLLFIFLYLVCKPRLFSIKSGPFFFGILAALFIYALGDNNFRKILSQPDTIPAAALLFLVAFFFWVALHQAHENDKRAASGKPPKETEYKEKVGAWPDLVYIELISMVLVTSLLIIWSLLVSAPLEEWAEPGRSPNPSKAPWYFLGLQELLLYFDPWIAGVVIPLLIVFGLMAIPYIDSSAGGSGYYSFTDRKFAILLFLSGFFLWVVLIIIGTFLRGQNWHYYGPFEERELIKSELAHLINLSDMAWTQVLGIKKPGHWFLREIFGIALLLFYLLALPILIWRSGSRKRGRVKAKSGIPRLITSFSRAFRGKEGRRHILTLFLLLLAGGVVIKMFLRLSFNIKYLLYLPEFLLNI